MKRSTYGKWNPIFAWLPIESMIHDHQQKYYDAINYANDQVESTDFIEFMLSIIKLSILDVISTTEEPTDKATVRWNKIQQFLKTHNFIMNADVRELCGVSSATANRILGGLVKEEKLTRYREGKHWAYAATVGC